MQSYLKVDCRPAPLLRASTMRTDILDPETPVKVRFIDTEKSHSGSVDKNNEDSEGNEYSEGGAEVSMNYRLFARKNIFNIDILNIYCDELTNTPYQENIQNDLVVGKWLDEIIPSLSQELFPLIQEVARFHIDTSILDIYKNLLISIGKRYELVMKLVVGSLYPGY